MIKLHPSIMSAVSWELICLKLRRIWNAEEEIPERFKRLLDALK